MVSLLSGSVVGLLGATCGARLTLGLFVLSHLHLHTSQLRIDENTTAVLAHDDLLVHLDIELTLWRNLVEATTASITLHIHDTQTIASTLADTLEAAEQTSVDSRDLVLVSEFLNIYLLAKKVGSVGRERFLRVWSLVSSCVEFGLFVCRVWALRV